MRQVRQVRQTAPDSPDSLCSILIELSNVRYRSNIPALARCGVPARKPTAVGQTDHVRLDQVSVTEVLAQAGCIAASEEAEELIRAAGGDTEVLADLVTRRTTGEPIAWLTGTLTFCGVELLIAPGVYVPRWQTEPLARRASALLPSAGIGADLCTGAGAIAAVMATTVPRARVDRNRARSGRGALCQGQWRGGIRGFPGRSAAAGIRAPR